MKEDRNNCSQGELCICSVQKREKGFGDYRFIAYKAASELGFYVVRNPENIGITQDDFEKVLRTQYPVFILIVGQVESDVVSREFQIAKEQCLPIFIFIKQHYGTISQNSTHIINKLSDVDYNYNCTVFENCEDLYLHVHNRLSSYIKEKNTLNPILQKGVGLAYTTNQYVMGKAKKQIIVYQKTSILLLGPRKGYCYEVQFYRELIDWLKKAKENIEFIHVFNLEETLKEIKEKSYEYDLDLAKSNLTKLYEIYQINEKTNCLNIKYSKVQNSVGYIIADTNLVFVVPIENERYTIVLPSHIMKATEIEKIKEELYSKTTLLKESELSKIYDVGR